MNSAPIIFCVLACVYAKPVQNTFGLKHNMTVVYATDFPIHRPDENKIKRDRQTDENTFELKHNMTVVYATDFPIHRPDENEIKPAAPTICKITSVCAWSLFNPNTKEVERTIINETCVCGPGKKCKVVQTSLGAHMQTHQCVSSDQY